MLRMGLTQRDLSNALAQFARGYVLASTSRLDTVGEGPAEVLREIPRPHAALLSYTLVRPAVVVRNPCSRHLTGYASEGEKIAQEGQRAGY